MRLVLALIALPLVEIALFVQIGRWLGLWPVLGLVVAAAAVGVAVLASGRTRTLGDLQAALERERDPSGPLAHGALRMIGGLLLVMPGFFTDAMGLLLLFPGMRALLLRQLLAGVNVSHASVHARTTQTRPRAHGDVIDGDFEVHEPRSDSPWRELPPDPPEKRH